MAELKLTAGKRQNELRERRPSGIQGHASCVVSADRSRSSFQNASTDWLKLMYSNASHLAARRAPL